MEEYLKEALEIVKAQAGVRNMTEEEIASMLARVSFGIKEISEGAEPEESDTEICQDPKKAIREKTIMCLECGKTFKVLTKRHLASHGITVAEYKARHGYKKGASLICKALARERRKKMQDMKLWQKRGKKTPEAAPAPEE